MPGLMARLLIDLISERIVHLLVATSTLSEGVNLPYISERETKTNEYLNAINIKNWVEQSFYNVQRHLPTPKPPNQINVNLLKDFSKAPSKNWRVVPVEIGDDIQWFDLARFPLAICQKPEKWQSDFLNTYDFMLDAENRFFSSKIYV